MAKPIGERLLEAVSILEQIGPCHAEDVQRLMRDMHKDHGYKYLGCAADRGWVTVTGGLRKRVYAVVPGWDVAAKIRQQTGVHPLVRPRLPKVHELQAAWM